MVTFGNYNRIEKALRQGTSKIDIGTLKVSKAMCLFELHEYKSSKKMLMEILDSLSSAKVLCNLQVLNILIKLCFLLGELKVVLNIVKENEDILKLEKKDFFYVNTISAYSEYRKGEAEFPIKELHCKANDEIKRSLLYYICFLICRHESFSLEFLNRSVKEFPLNMSSISEILKQGKNVGTTALTFAFEVDKELFNVLDFRNYQSLNLEVDVFGGGDSIGGSCFVMDFHGTKIMVDAGIDIIKSGVLNSRNFQQSNIEYLFITHGHLDHCGALLEVYKKKPKIKILMTEETRELIRSSLTNQGLDYNDTVALYNCLKFANIIGFRQPLKLKCEDDSYLDLEFFRAGHILGATSIYLCNKGVGVYVTGDCCLFNQETVQGMDIPIDYKIDLLVTETTHGIRENESFSDREFQRQKLIYMVKEALANGKKVFIPSFSIGHAQELICCLRKQLNVFENERLYIDDSVVKCNRLYEKFLDFSFVGNGIYNLEDRFYGNKKEFINQQILNNKSCVIIGNSSMQNGSIAMECYKEFLKRENCLCILSGHTGEDNTAFYLEKEKPSSNDRYTSIDGDLIKLKCQVEQINISSHCPMEEIMVLVAKLKPKKVLLMHGNVQQEVEKSYINEVLSRNSTLEVVQGRNKTKVVF